jgi:hypothetical protein
MITFSDNQALNPTGQTVSASFDSGAVGAPNVDGQRFVIKSGDVAPISFAGAGGMFQVMLQTSLNGTTWGDFQGLCPPLNIKTFAAGATLVTMRIPAGLPRYLRLAYRVLSGTASGKISATAEALAPDRFGYQPSAIPGIKWGTAT